MDAHPDLDPLREEPAERGDQLGTIAQPPIRVVEKFIATLIVLRRGGDWRSRDWHSRDWHSGGRRRLPGPGGGR